MNNGILDMLETHLKKIEYSKLMNTDLQNINYKLYFLINNNGYRH